MFTFKASKSIHTVYERNRAIIGEYEMCVLNHIRVIGVLILVLMLILPSSTILVDAETYDKEAKIYIHIYGDGRIRVKATGGMKNTYGLREHDYININILEDGAELNVFSNITASLSGNGGGYEEQRCWYDEEQGVMYLVVYRDYVKDGYRHIANVTGVIFYYEKLNKVLINYTLYEWNYDRHGNLVNKSDEQRIVELEHFAYSPQTHIRKMIVSTLADNASLKLVKYYRRLEVLAGKNGYLAMTEKDVYSGDPRKFIEIIAKSNSEDIWNFMKGFMKSFMYWIAIPNDFRGVYNYTDKIISVEVMYPIIYWHEGVLNELAVFLLDSNYPEDTPVEITADEGVWVSATEVALSDLPSVEVRFSGEIITENPWWKTTTTASEEETPIENKTMVYESVTKTSEMPTTTESIAEEAEASTTTKAGSTSEAGTANAWPTTTGQGKAGVATHTISATATQSAGGANLMVYGVVAVIIVVAVATVIAIGKKR